jgi:uncharacterized protein (DUF2235 family)
LPFTSSNKSVRRVRHAVSIDERRGFFAPSLYMPEPSNPESLRKLHGDIKEVWFAGVHSDVGGGYPRDEQALAQIPLKWMLRESVWSELNGDTGGLRLDPAKVDRVLTEKYAEVNAGADQHWSLTPGWRIAEFVPRVAYRQRADHSWGRSVTINLFRRRRVPKGAVLHASVRARWNARTDWRPPNLGDPAQYPVEN